VATVVVSSFFFASQHPGLSHLLPIFVVGSLFAGLFATSKRGSLAAPFVAHATFNAVNVVFEVAFGRS
ncbi:CPBP family intramembrane metalloprotease, partial [bacterium]|nr:CPBP family intramembrane metalloprotease [bacterium]